LDEIQYVAIDILLFWERVRVPLQHIYIHAVGGKEEEKERCTSLSLFYSSGHARSVKKMFYMNARQQMMSAPFVTIYLI